MGSRLLNAPIVLDNGSGTIRAGFAGQDLPKCYFPSYVGRPKHVRALAGALEGDVFIGPRAQELRGLLKINYPLEHGIVTDWDDMERIWQYVYAEELKTVSEDVSAPTHQHEAFKLPGISSGTIQTLLTANASSILSSSPSRRSIPAQIVTLLLRSCSKRSTCPRSIPRYRQSFHSTLRAALPVSCWMRVTVYHTLFLCTAASKSTTPSKG